MKLTLRCMIHEVPVEILIEGLDLDPCRACSLLSIYLKEADATLNRITLEKGSESGDRPPKPISPRVNLTVQTTHLGEATL